MDVACAIMVMPVIMFAGGVTVRRAGVPSYTAMIGMIIMIGTPMLIMIPSHAPVSCFIHAAGPPRL